MASTSNQLSLLFQTKVRYPLEQVGVQRHPTDPETLQFESQAVYHPATMPLFGQNICQTIQGHMCCRLCFHFRFRLRFFTSLLACALQQSLLFPFYMSRTFLSCVHQSKANTHNPLAPTLFVCFFRVIQAFLMSIQFLRSFLPSTGAYISKG